MEILFPSVSHQEKLRKRLILLFSILILVGILIEYQIDSFYFLTFIKLNFW